MRCCSACTTRRRGALTYVGHTGTGFNQAELERVWKLLKPREIPQLAVLDPVKTNEPAHWVRPDLVAQVRFTEWTADAKLRHPVYLGLRDDKRPEDVRRERGRHGQVGHVGKSGRSSNGEVGRTKTAAPAPATRAGETREASSRPKIAAHRADSAIDAVIDQLRALEDARRDGTIELPGRHAARRHQPREGVLAGRRS